MISRLFLFLIFSVISTATHAESYSPILQGMLPGTITFIGETHQHPESAQLIKQLVTEALNQHQCLTLGLEIDDSQQRIIDKVMSGTASAADIQIPPAIDHPAMRQLIEDLAKMGAQPACLKLLAIDTSVETEFDRDEWMAQKLSALLGDQPILVLLGGFHTLKKINWTIKNGKPSVAEILEHQGFHVRSFPQRWIPENCPGHSGRSSRFVSAENPEALKIINNSYISLINAKPYRSARGVVDGLVVWECSYLPNELQNSRKEPHESFHHQPYEISDVSGADQFINNCFLLG